MLKTNEYAIFKKHPSNREINIANLRKIKLSLASKNMLHLRPIIVNEKYEIIDGQHRLQAAKELGLDIFYVVNENSKDFDIVALNNNQKRWEAEDYLNYYCSQNLEHYLTFKEIIVSNNLPIRAGLALLGGVGGTNYEQFRNGQLDLSEWNAKKQEINLKIAMIRRFQDILKAKLVYSQKFYLSPWFIRAFFCLSNADGFMEEVFFKKLESKIDAIHPCSSLKAYFEMFKSIYNFKNQCPID